MDSRAMTVAATVSILEAVAELEQGGQQVVLAADLLGLPGLLLDPVVLGTERLVVDAQAVDLADRGGDRADVAADPVERTLDRPEGEAQTPLELDARAGWPRRPSSRGSATSTEM